MLRLSIIKNYSIFTVLLSFLISLSIIGTQSFAQENNPEPQQRAFDLGSLGSIGNLNLNSLINGAGQGSSMRRDLNKGISQGEVEQNLENFSGKNVSNMDAGCCRGTTEWSTYGHDEDSLKNAYDISFTFEDSRCIIDYTYEGNGNVVGKLWKFIGCCDTYCYYTLWIRADEIAYRFPVETRESSIHIGDSMLRINYASGHTPGNNPNKPRPTPRPTPVGTPSSGSGGVVEGNNCNYEKASSIAQQGGYDENYINWVMSIGERESGFSDKEASTNFYNMPSNTYNENGKQTGWKNANVANGMAKGMSLEEAQAMYGDYGYYQNNAYDSQMAKEKYGLSQESADALSNGGGKGNYTVEQQTLAMAEYIEKKYPNAAAAAKNGDYAAADNEVDNFWFAARKPNPCVGKKDTQSGDSNLAQN